MRILLPALAVLAACVDPTSSDSAAPSSYDDSVLHADVADAEGSETIRASIADVTILDARGAVLATTPAYRPQGSADEVDGIRVIDRAYVGAPLIAVTTTLGGRRENTTFTVLYRLDGRALETVFAAPIEHVEDHRAVSGALLVFPGTLLYRAPYAEQMTLLSFDAGARRFVAH